MNNVNPLMARPLLGQIFLLAGLGKISAYQGTQGYIGAILIDERVNT